MRQTRAKRGIGWLRDAWKGASWAAFLLCGALLAGCSTAPTTALQTPLPAAAGPVQPQAVLQPGTSPASEGDGGVAAVTSPVAFLLPEETASQFPPPVSGKAYIVVNARSGKVLAERNAHLRLPVASTQKLLTALVLLDGGKMDEMVTVAASDTHVEPTTMGIRAGERYRKRDLLEALMVRSCNDIAKCLARNHAGSEARFANALNAKAAALGMKESHFVNSHGLSDPGGYSSAFDLAILGRAAASHPVLHRLTDIRETDFRFADGRVQHLWNTNRVLYMSPYCRGLKTGYTEAAGRCLVTCGERAGRRVITVILGSKQPDIWTDSTKLLHWGLGVGSPT